MLAGGLEVEGNRAEADMARCASSDDRRYVHELIFIIKAVSMVDLREKIMHLFQDFSGVCVFLNCRSDPAG